MAKRLTEEMVIARTKISDLSKIKKLNCWGSDLVDVSLLRRMPCVEVVSLSINKITSLEDFKFCKNLEELYIRQNDIKNLNQICYLQDLTNLKSLWLGENPCSSNDGEYRLSVIKTLPQLKKLDNIEVTLEEIKEAQKIGLVLVHPEAEPSIVEEDCPSPMLDLNNESEQQSTLSLRDSSESNNLPNSPHNNNVEEIPEKNNELAINQESYQQKPEQPASLNDDPPPKQKERIMSAPPNQQQSPPRRPVSRNSNILSAVLCLIKELEYTSLEVVEMAVRYRMDELIN